MEYAYLMVCAVVGGLLMGSILAMIKIVYERWSR